MALAEVLGERLHGGRRGVVAKNVKQHGKQRALAVRPGPVEEKERVFLGEAGKRISEGALQIADQVAITTAHSIEELPPLGALAFRPDARAFRDAVGRPML